MAFCAVELLVPGALLLEEVVNSCGIEAINAVIYSVQERFNESQKEKADGSVFWWRVS